MCCKAELTLDASGMLFTPQNGRGVSTYLLGISGGTEAMDQASMSQIDVQLASASLTIVNSLEWMFSLMRRPAIVNKRVLCFLLPIKSLCFPFVLFGDDYSLFVGATIFVLLCT